ncbi:hypothetical protein V6Z12_D02G013700 [Gossypium hirsutum]
MIHGIYLVVIQSHHMIRNGFLFTRKRISMQTVSPR